MKRERKAEEYTKMVDGRNLAVVAALQNSTLLCLVLHTTDMTM